MKLEQIGGAALTLLFLADIFLTVLYARAGTGLLAPRWNRAVWSVLKALSSMLGPRRSDTVLSLAGPIIVVLLIAFWAIGLTVGAALVIQPELGLTIKPSTGDTPTDFVTALLVGGNSLSIVGSGDYSPHSTGTRLFFLFNSLVGASVLSLVLSYLVQVYSALRERNALALAIDLRTDGTGNAARMLVLLGPGGDLDGATTELGNVVRPLAAIKEAHHFYPLLFYFRFTDPVYSVSRLTFVLLDLTTLIDTTLDPQRYGSLVHSSSVASLRRGALLLLETLETNFPTTAGRVQGVTDDVCDRLREHHAAAVERLKSAGIETRSDAARYLDQRRHWEPLLRRVAPALGYPMSAIEAEPQRSIQGS